jgi:uncharacterized protein
VLAVTAITTASGRGLTTRPRLPGPDAARGLALIGVVVMNYHGYLLLQHDTRGDSVVQRFFDPWNGPLSTRFAATFVVIAGVGVTLMTRGASDDPAAVGRLRWTLVRRGLVLYGGGLLLDEVWSGTILPYYGAMFVVAALLFTLRTRWVLSVGAAAAVAGAAIAWWRLEQRLDGRAGTWFDDAGPRSPRRWALGVLVNGTHPLLPWLAFLGAGIVVGRSFGRRRWRPVVIGVGLALFVLATAVGSSDLGGRRAALFSTVASSRSLVYTTSALGTALASFGIVTWLAERYAPSAPIRWLGAAGAMSLTLYVTHALVFDLLVNVLGWIGPTGLDTALAFAAVYWVIAVAFAVAWRERVGIGPVEWVYRRLGG